MRVVSVLALTYLFISSVSAESTKSFYARNSARSLFESEVETTNQPEIIDTISLSKKQQQEMPELSKVALSAQGQDPEKKQFFSKEELFELYGDPKAEVPMLGRDDAPKPFKAMMRALESGHTELAEQYAAQFTGYLEKVKDRNETVVAMFRKNMKQRKEDKEQKLLSQAQLDELKLREEVRDSLKDSVYVDPKGELDIYFIFRFDQQLSVQMINEIKELDASLLGLKSGQVKLLALSMDDLSDDQIVKEAVRLEMKMPVMSGEFMAKSFNVDNVPALVIVPRNNPQKFVIEKGYRRFFYLDELVSHMRGAK